MSRHEVLFPCVSHHGSGVSQSDFVSLVCDFNDTNMEQDISYQEEEIPIQKSVPEAETPVDDDPIEDAQNPFAKPSENQYDADGSLDGTQVRAGIEIL